MLSVSEIRQAAESDEERYVEPQWSVALMSFLKRQIRGGAGEERSSRSLQQRGKPVIFAKDENYF